MRDAKNISSTEALRPTLRWKFKSLYLIFERSLRQILTRIWLETVQHSTKEYIQQLPHATNI